MGLSDADVGLMPQAREAPAQELSGGLSDEAVGLQPAFEREAAQGPRVLESVGRAAADVGKGAGKAVLAAGDMLLGAPAALAGWFIGTGAQAYAAAKGESAKTQGEVGEMAEVLPEIPIPGTNRTIPLEVLKTPLQSIMKIFTGEEPFDQKIVEQAIEKGSLAVEKTGVMTAESARRLLNGWMNMAFVRAGPAMVKEAFKKKAATGKEAKGSYEEAAMSEEGVPLENPDPARYKPAYDAEGKLSGWEDNSKPISDKDLGVVTPKDVKAIFERAKKGEDLAAGDVQTVKDFFEAAKKKGQTGEIDPNVIKALAAGAAVGALGIGGYELYKEWQRHKTLIEQLELENKSWRDLERRRQEEEERQRKPDQELTPKKGVVVAGLGAAAALGAMRVKGTGVWHEGAVKALAEPLKGSLVQTTRELRPQFNSLSDAVDAARAALQPKVEWADKIVKRYLDKTAGTAEDPLASIEIPFGEGTATWGSLTDKAFRAADIPTRLRLMKEGKAEMGEPIWDVEKGQRVGGIGTQVMPEAAALKSYISHAGDYAQRIPAEKLAQYDFVRLIKETAAEDARLAKAAEKSQAKLLGDAPVYKDYGDGMRWVQLNKPGQFAWNSEKMGHSVRGYEPPGGPRYQSNVSNAPHPDWIEASGEGGHPSYGLGGWEAIKRGDAKIYTLVDKKGEPHVTVEVDPGEFFTNLDTDGIRRAVWDSEKNPPRITQIKGKSNRAPAAAYLPYVQDFVKGGKWGDVGDLEGTGLLPFRTAVGTVDPYVYTHETSVHPQDTGLKPGYYTKAELHEAYSKAGARLDKNFPHDEAAIAIEKKYSGAQSQRGASTPETLVALSAAGVGALIGMQDSDSPIRSGIYGALAGLALGHPAGRAALKSVIKSPDVALGAISTRLGNMHPALKMMERRHELNILRQIDQLNDQVLPFAQAFDKLPKEQQLAAGRMLMNGQEPMLQQILTLAPTLPGMRKALNSIEAQLKSLGRFKEGLSGYFPRMVSDLEGLKKALGAQHAVGIEKVLVTAEAEMIRKASRGLTDVEQSLVVNRYLHAADQTSFQPGFAKGRRVGEVTPELQPFYEPPVESLLRYISGAVSDIQTAKFFGRDLKVNKHGAKVSNDVDASIGNLASRLITEGKITREQGLELRDILKARFEGGDKGMSTGLAAARNLTNTALLGNIASAATQVGDSLMTIYHHGAVPTIQALAEKIIGRQRITPKQLGLINHVAEELSEMGITGRALHNTMKYSGFHAVDMFGKGLMLNASLAKNTALAKTPKGTALLIERYGKAFGDEMPQLLEDLRNRRVSDNVETLAFSELSDAQPVSKAEMSEAYLRHPNGRVLWQLKTYMMKQTDILRRDVYQNIASGNPKRIMQGTKNLAALGAIYALANVPGDVIKDILAGRDVDPFTTPKLVENVLQTFGINRYAQERLSQGKVVETAQDLATPPVRVFQDIAKGDSKALSYIPLVGRPIYERWFGGNERREISEKRSANLGVPKSERQTLSPAAKEYLRQKRLEAKERKLRREQ